jgi:hypothetical protein
MDKILITGGNGLVGSEFKGDQYLKPSSKEYNLKDKDQTYRLMLKGFDGIIHCAAKVGGVGANMNYKGEFFYDNIMINTNLYDGSLVAYHFESKTRGKDLENQKGEYYDYTNTLFPFIEKNYNKLFNNKLQ